MSEFTLFYGGVFSQWYRCQFDIDGVEYNCAEQFMMAQKAALFGDEDAIARIMKAAHPRDQKAIGRQVKGFDATQWNDVARDLVYEGNYAKFTQDSRLKEKILATTGTLVEASPTDKIWGIGRSESDPLALNRDTWRGKNWLGEVLTKVREDIVAGVKSTTFEWS
jgi:ribA/ribD-fused uncharacterized protein